VQHGHGAAMEARMQSSVRRSPRERIHLGPLNSSRLSIFFSGLDLVRVVVVRCDSVCLLALSRTRSLGRATSGTPS
jgi:hypothetical protein